MITLLSHKVNLKNEAGRYHVNFIKNALCSFSFIAAGIVLLVVLSSALNPQPNSAEGWILFALLAVISVSLIFIVKFAAKILSSSYCVFAVYRNDTITITPLSEVALKNIGSRVKASFNGSLKAARKASKVMQDFVERYDFEDFFLDSDFCYYYSHRITTLRSIRQIGKYTVIRCKTEKYDPIAKKQKPRNCTFYINKAEFENSEELISVLNSQLRMGL